MIPFTSLTGVAAPMPTPNIDTDQIIPARFLKTVERKGLGQALFADLRRDGAGREREDFVLNQPAYAGTQILIAGDNFGCGSSREHAPWALMDYGVRCVIAPSFADIFYNNSINNGLLPLVLPQAEVDALLEEARGGNHRFTVDLQAQTVTAPSGRTVRFDIDPGRRTKLLEGLDAIGETLRAAPAIDAFEARRAAAQPWLSRSVSA